MVGMPAASQTLLHHCVLAGSSHAHQKTFGKYDHCKTVPTAMVMFGNRRKGPRCKSAIALLHVPTSRSTKLQLVCQTCADTRGGSKKLCSMA